MSFFQSNLTTPLTQSIGRPISAELHAENEFQLRHGMSRADYAERQRQRARERFEEKALAGYDADPPGKTAKARLEAFVQWLKRTQDELATLESQRAALQAAIEAPAQAKARRDGLLKTLARKLLGGEDVEGFDALQVRAVEDEHAAAQCRAEAARLAMADLEQAIEIKRLQVKRLEERQPGFICEAMAEHIDATLGPRYREAVDELRAALTEVWAAREAAGLSNGSRVVELPFDAKILPDRSKVVTWRKAVDGWTR